MGRRDPNPINCNEEGINKHRKLIGNCRLFQFLPGLDGRYDKLCRDILKKVPVTSVESAFSKVKREAARLQNLQPATNRSDIDASSSGGVGAGLAATHRPTQRPEVQPPHTAAGPGNTPEWWENNHKIAKGKKASDDDEVEQLLRAAQDDVLLKLSVDSHTARGSGAAAIDPDLDRRFLALKNSPKEAHAGDSKAADDELFIRFAALKSSLPSNSSNFTKEEEAAEEDEEDEVEKVIRWATDAARLDPSPPSEDDDDDDDDVEVSRGKKSKRK